MVYVVYKKAGEWRWRLYINANTPQQKILADSGMGYASKDECLADIRLVQNSGNAGFLESDDAQA